MSGKRARPSEKDPKALELEQQILKVVAAILLSYSGSSTQHGKSIPKQELLQVFPMGPEEEETDLQPAVRITNAVLKET